MGIQNYYKSLKILNYKPAYFGTEGGTYTHKITFKGLIQPPNARTFTTLGQFNSKDTARIAAVLYCSEKQRFEPKDIIEDVNGIRYRIFDDELGIQASGATGIKPKHGQHAEYKLEYFQGDANVQQ